MRLFLRLAGPLGLALLTALLLSAPASSTVYYLRIDGCNDSTGTANADSTSANSAWRTLEHANATLDSGDVLQVVSLAVVDTVGGDTLTTIYPSRNGTAANRIRYIGNPASPLSLGMSNLRLSKAYITVSGFRFREAANLDYQNEGNKPVGDSLTYCHMPRLGLAMAKNPVISNCTIRNESALPSVRLMGNAWSIGPPAAIGDTKGCVIEDCEVDGGQVAGGSQRRVFEARYAHSDTIRRCTFTWQFTGTNDDPIGRNLQKCRNVLFQDCKWTCEADWFTYKRAATSPYSPDSALGFGGDWRAFSMSDTNLYVTFERDTVYAGLGSGKPIGGLVASTGPNGYCRWLSCVYQTTGGVSSVATPYAAELNSSIFEATSDRGLDLDGLNTSVITQCTIGGNQSCGLGSAFAVRGGASSFWASSITNNVFHTDSAYQGAQQGLAYYGNPSEVNYIDQNVYWAPVASGGYQHAIGAPGFVADARVGAGGSWCNSYVHDCSSVWGNPLFGDPYYDATSFNSTPQSGSAAVGAAFEPLGYAGAIAPPDTIPPDSCHATVTSAGALDSGSHHWRSYVVEWTNPGDDGTVGQIDSLQIAVRFSNDDSLLPTPETFGASRVTSSEVAANSVYLYGLDFVLLPEIVPGAPGEVQQAVVTLDYGILAIPPLTVRVLVKAIDSSGNASYGRGYYTTGP